MPELITVCWAHGRSHQAIYSVQGEMEIFNPIEPRVYSTMDTLLREVKERFPSNYIHLGKDTIFAD
jgi:N-acetyl-beta-hexosaminidase